MDIGNSYGQKSVERTILANMYVGYFSSFFNLNRYINSSTGTKFLHVIDQWLMVKSESAVASTTFFMQ